MVEHLSKICAARYSSQEYPSLASQWARFRAERPFAGKKLLDCTPLFTNTLVKFLPLLAGGAELTVSVSDRIPHDPEVLAVLDRVGIPFVVNGTVADDAFDVILDCDGSRAAARPTIGVCELTRSGIYHYAEAGRPVVLVDASKIKEIETTIGTGNGYLRAMRELGYRDWKGRRIVIFGQGKVGRGVAYYCAREGAHVVAVDRLDAGIVFDRNSVSEVVDCRDVAAVKRAVRGADHLITATGVRGAMCGYGFTDADLKGVVISAIGIEDEWLTARDPATLVNGGRAVNFRLAEPTLLRYIDPTMALSNESARDLVEGRIAEKGIVPPLADSEKRCLEPIVECGLIAEELRAMKFI